MRMPRTPDHLRHILAAFAFGGIAAATLDPRFGSPALGVAAAAVAVGLLLKKSFAKPMGAGLAAAWLLFLAFPRFLPEWSSPEWACAGLAAIALGTLWLTPRFGRMSARGALACASAGLVVGTLRWHHYDELWVLGEQLPTLAVLAAAGALAFFRPRAAASVVVGAAAVSVLGLRTDSWLLSAVFFGVSAWIAEHALRAYEQRPTELTRVERPASWLAVGLFGSATLAAGVKVLANGHVRADDLVGLVVMTGLLACIGTGVARRAPWGGPLGVGVGLGALALQGDALGGWTGWLLLAGGVVLAPSLSRLSARRGLGLAGLGAALGGGVIYLLAFEAHDALGFILVAAAAALLAAGVVGFARGRTWSVLATAMATLPLYVACVVIGEVSLASLGTCSPMYPFPSAIALGGLYLALATYAGPTLAALRESRVS